MCSEYSPNFDPSKTYEQLQIKPADCVVFFGRGIERVNIKQANGSKREVSKPTRYIQRLEKPSGQSGAVRTGKRSLEEPLHSFSPEDEVQEMVGGGTANVIAAAHVYEVLKQRGQVPKEIIISGGRPKYLENQEPTLTEAKVMKRELLRKLGSDRSSIAEDKVTILEESKNTQDDLINSLRLCHSRGYRNVALVNADIAMGRTKAFFDTILEDPKDPDHQIFKELNVQFISADDVLELRMGKRFRKIKQQLTKTAAYEGTVKNEAIGEEKVRFGKYGEGGHGKGNY